jgi:hypothetical protein
MQPDPFPLAGRQRTRLVPDAAWDPGPAEVVQQPGPADLGDRGGIQAQLAGGPGGDLGHPSGVAEQKRRPEVDQVPEGGRDAVQVGLVDQPPRLRLGLDHGGAGVVHADFGEQPRAWRTKAAAIAGSR